MRHFAVALDAASITSGMGRQGDFRDVVGVAPNAVGLDHFLRLFLGSDHLRLHPQSEKSGMAEAIVGLKPVLAKD